jgi:hypothetical protein
MSHQLPLIIVKELCKLERIIIHVRPMLTNEFVAARRRGNSIAWQGSVVR